MLKKSYCKQNGFVEISMMNMLVIMCVIVIVAGLGINMLYGQYKKYRFGQEVNDIKAAALSYKGGGSSYSGISLANLCTEELLNSNSDMCTSADTSNPYGGTWSVEAGSNPSELIITATNIDSSAGSALARNYEQEGTVSFSGTTFTMTE